MNNAEWLLSQPLPELIDRHTREVLFVLGDDVIPRGFGEVFPPGTSGDRFVMLRELLARAYADALRLVATDSAGRAAPREIVRERPGPAVAGMPMH